MVAKFSWYRFNAMMAASVFAAGGRFPVQPIRKKLRCAADFASAPQPKDQHRAFLLCMELESSVQAKFTRKSGGRSAPACAMAGLSKSLIMILTWWRRGRTRPGKDGLGKAPIGLACLLHDVFTDRMRAQPRLPRIKSYNDTHKTEYWGLAGTKPRPPPRCSATTPRQESRRRRTDCFTET